MMSDKVVKTVNAPDYDKNDDGRIDAKEDPKLRMNHLDVNNKREKLPRRMVTQRLKKLR
jgi:hypothetical protein